MSVGVHKLKIDEKPFAAIESGSKTVDLRQDEAKFAHYQIGDHLIFKDGRNNRQIETRIVDLRYFDTIEAALNDWGYENFVPYVNSFEDAVKQYRHRFGNTQSRLFAIKVKKI